MRPRRWRCAQVFVHDLATVRKLAQLEKTKGCSLYAIDVQDRDDPTLDSHRCGENKDRWVH